MKYTAIKNIAKEIRFNPSIESITIAQRALYFFIASRGVKPDPIVVDAWYDLLNEDFDDEEIIEMCSAAYSANGSCRATLGDLLEFGLPTKTVEDDDPSSDLPS